MTFRIAVWSSLLLFIGVCFSPGTPQALTQQQTVVIAGQALAGSDTLFNAKITITLVGSPCYTSTDLMPSVSVTTYSSPTTGLWSKTIVGTDSISCSGGQTPTYDIIVEDDVLTASGQKIEYRGLSIPATNGATTQLRTIVSQQ